MNSIWYMIGGLLIVLFGLSMIIKAIFGFDIPLIKIAIGIFLIYLGSSMIFSDTKPRFRPNFINKLNMFQQSNTTINNPLKFEKYTIAFGNGVFDFSTMSEPNEPIKININTIMGSTRIILNPTIPTKVSISTNFSKVELPNGAEHSFGEFIYRNYDAEIKPLLEIKALVFLGSLQIQEIK